MTLSVKGATTNGSGTKIAAAVKMGSAPAVAPTNASLDHCTLVPHGNMLIPVKTAINMGLLERDPVSGVLSELNPAATPTRVNA